MPSPFPGMDPYLESPELWPDVHHALISEIQASLNEKLRPAYRAMVEERVYVSDETDPGRSVTVPDVAILATRSIGTSVASPQRVAPNDVVAVAEPIFATTLLNEEIREARIVIYDSEGRQAVTVIEILSPSNKTIGARGRADYESKRHTILQSPSHFVEIDLLRRGEAIYTREKLPQHDYLVHVSKSKDRPRALLWPILLSQRLPVIPIPLLAKDPDVELDLNVVLNAAYDRAGYDMVVDYRKPPKVPLAEPNATWCRNWLEGAAL